MARTTISPISTPAPYAPSSNTLTFTAADDVNGNQVLLTGREIIIAYNSDSVDHTITVSSVACPHDRTGDATKTIAAGEYELFQMFPTLGWQQADGYLYFSSDSATVKFVVIKVR